MKILFTLLTVVGVLWIQLAANYFGGTAGFTANLVLTVVLYFGLSRGPLSGLWLGFVWGLLIDASSLGVIGLHAVLYAGAGYLAGMLRRQLDGKKVWTQTIFTLGVSVVYILLYYLVTLLFSFGPHSVSWSIIAQPFINGALAPFFFWLIYQWEQVWRMQRQDQ